MVAVVRDDGDVDAFLVRHIVQAIERRAESESTIGIQGDEIRPFFQSNVGISAWGLAIHSEARILATSSNAHEVRVFKFGLLQSDEDDDLYQHEHDLSDSDEDHPHPTGHRTTDVTHHVLNGETNIPCISFCNTGDDPDARWLLTTDISGVCRVMDLHALQPVQAFRFGRSFVSPTTGGLDRLNAGWGLMFLDRRSFLPETNVRRALGLEEGETLPGITRSESIWDLSKTIRCLPESERPFVHWPLDARSRGAPTAVEAGADDTQAEMVSSTHPQDGDFGDFDSENESDGGAPVDMEIEMSRYETDSDDDDQTNYETFDPDPMTVSAEEDPSASLPGTYPTESSSPLEDSASRDDPSLVELSPDDMDPEDEGTEDNVSYTSFYNGDSICGNEPRFTTSGPLCDGLPCPILHASVRNIYLLQPPDQRSRSEVNERLPLNPPLLGFANPLRQNIQAGYGYLRFFERLNMNAYIPELGLVVLASQKGRAIVLALTKIPSATRSKPSTTQSTAPPTYPPEMASYKHKSNYCMRVVALLPFSDQETKNQRPFAPLHGIAVAPLQGTTAGSDGHAMAYEGTRYRLMMCYQDHSILSYELRRPGRGEEDGRTHTAGFQDGELVV